MTITDQKTPPVSGFGTVYMAMFVMAAGNFAMMSIFPAIARSSGIPDVLMVAVQSLSAAVSIFTTPFWASRSDHVGRKKIALIGIAGFTIASALTAGAIVIATHRLAPVLVAVAALAGSRAVFGAIGLAAMPAIQAHVADETLPVMRTRALASLMSANALGTVVGPGIAPLLILPVLGLAGPQTLFFLAGLLIFVAVRGRLPDKPALLHLSDQVAMPRLTVLRQPSVWPFVAYMVLLGGFQASNLQILGFVIMDRTGLSPVQAQPLSGMAIMAGALAAVAIQLGLLRRVHLSPSMLMVCGISIVIIGNLLMIPATSYFLVASSFVITSVGYALGIPAAAAGASLANPPHQQGVIAGMISAAGASGFLAAPVIAILLYRHSPAAPFLAIATCLVLTALTIVPRCWRAGERNVPN